MRNNIRDYIKGFVRPKNLLFVPEVVEKPTGNNVLVLSPHFDDDIFGCGGTLCKHILSGNKVTIVYFTDGREGDPSCPDKGLVEKTRKEEAGKATSLLGINDLIFLDQPETMLKPVPSVIKSLGEIITTIRPDLVYLPVFAEAHIDHLELNRIFLLLSSEVDLNFNVCAYEVWTPLIPNIIVDISDVVTRKKEAMEQYVSQIRRIDYVNTVLALNRYRSISALKGQGYAEAFLCLPSREYIKILKEIQIDRRTFIDGKYLAWIRKMSRSLGARGNRL